MESKFEVGDIVKYVNNSRDLGTTPARSLKIGRCYRVRGTLPSPYPRLEVDELTGKRIEAWPIAARFEKI